MRLPRFSGIAALAALATAPIDAQACWEEAAQRYGVSADLLYAIARVESDLNPQAVNRSHAQRTGSYDIGLMQINSCHLPALSRHGIREADLLMPCTNIQVGAWLLAELFSRHGATWEAVGTYNAACSTDFWAHKWHPLAALPSCGFSHWLSTGFPPMTVENSRRGECLP